MTEKTIKKAPDNQNQKIANEIKDLLDTTITPVFDTIQVEKLKALCRKYFN